MKYIRIQIHIIEGWLKEWVLSKKIIIFLFLSNLAILLLHILKVPFIQVDNTTILLLALLLITPFVSHITKIKLGDLEAELTRDIGELEQKVEDLSDDEEGQERRVRTESIEDELRELSIRDPALAFAKLRIEIEVRLKRLFIFAEEVKKPYSIGIMANTLATTGKISNRLRSIILDIGSILNRAVHGEEIQAGDNVDRVITIGVEVLNELDHTFYDEFAEPLSQKIISKRELSVYAKSKYEIVTIVPDEDQPYINKRVLTQEQLNQFLDGYDEFAEFLVKIKRV